jgi:hypothetical protein
MPLARLTPRRPQPLIADFNAWRQFACAPFALLVAAISSLLAIALILRRLAGALSSPLDWQIAIALGLLAIGLALAQQIVDRSRRTRGDRTGATLFVTAWCLIPLCLSLPGTTAASLTILWSACALAVLIALAGQWLISLPVLAPWLAVFRPARRSVTPPRAALLSACRREALAGGIEQVQGWVALDFVPGQRQQVAHVAFCPPFERVPNVQAALHDEPAASAARISVTQALPQGARIEVRLVGPAPAARRQIVEYRATGPVCVPAS